MAAQREARPSGSETRRGPTAAAPTSPARSLRRRSSRPRSYRKRVADRPRRSSPASSPVRRTCSAAPRSGRARRVRRPGRGDLQRVGEGRGQAELPCRDRHRPAGVDQVVDEQHRPADGPELELRERGPDRGQALRGVGVRQLRRRRRRWRPPVGRAVTTTDWAGGIDPAPSSIAPYQLGVEQRVGCLGHRVVGIVDQPNRGGPAQPCRSARRVRSRWPMTTPRWWLPARACGITSRR